MTNRLAEVRKAKLLTQSELSEIAGVSRVYISEIERGRQSVITNTVMLKLALALNSKVEDIFFINGVVEKQQDGSEERSALAERGDEKR